MSKKRAREQKKVKNQWFKITGITYIGMKILDIIFNLIFEEPIGKLLSCMKETILKIF
jgi:hypothetical protein